MMRLKNYLLLMLLLVSELILSQTLGTITGQVLGENGQPEEGVNIFLAQTSYGTATLSDGSFELNGIPPGQYSLAVSKVGFQEQIQTLVVKSGQNPTIIITLLTSSYHLDEVAVFGHQRETVHAIRLLVPLEQTPLTLNIVQNETLKQQQAISLEDALKNVSGVSKFGSYGLSDNINIRGFDIGLAGGPENYRVNGVMLRTPYSDYVEQVEVLKGPASILYGDVEPGGIINYVTKKPLGYHHASVELKVGEYGLLRPSLDLGGTLSENLSYRLNALYQETESFRDGVYGNQYMIAPSLLWNISDQTHLNFDALLMSNEVTIDWGMPLGLPLSMAKELDDSNFYGYPDGTSKGTNNMIMATLSHRLNDNWQIRNVTSFSNQDRLLHDVYPVYNATENIVDYSWGDYKERSRTNTFSNSLDLNGDLQIAGMRHRLQAGFDFSYISRPVAYNFIFPIETTTSLESPQWENTALSSTPQLNDDILPFTTRWGINVQDLISLYDGKLNILLGGRFSSFTTGEKYRGDADEPDDYADRTESKITPRLGVTYEIIDGTTLYGSYSESFSSIAPDPGRGLDDPDPLTGDQIEFGAKQSLFNDRLGLTLSYFDLNRKNVLQYNIIDANGSISDPSNFRANQSGEHSSSGVEFDINGKIRNNWQIQTAFSYFKTKVVRELVQSGDQEPLDFSGKELPNNPNTKLSIWTYYTLEQGIPGLSFGGGVFHQSDMFGDRLNTAENTIEAFTRVDLALAYEFKHLKFQVNANNIGDVKTFQRSLFGSYVPQFPRRIIASVTYKL